MNNAEQNQAIARTIRQQVGAMTMMACGAHNLLCGEGQLTFKVGGKRLTWCEIVLDPSDTYTVRVVKLKGGKYGSRVVASEQSGIYCDMLSELVYGLFNR
jgi:hypothetical protein